MLYEDHVSGARVRHRIVAIHGGHFVTKGDNNDFRDPVRPAPDEVLGELWVTVPGATSLMWWFAAHWRLSSELQVVQTGGWGT